MYDLPPDLQEFVHDEVAAGRYNDEVSVVTDELRLLRERERNREHLKAAIQVGLNQLERGEYVECDDDGLNATFAEIKAEGRARLDLTKSAP